MDTVEQRQPWVSNTTKHLSAAAWQQPEALRRAAFVAAAEPAWLAPASGSTLVLLTKPALIPLFRKGIRGRTCCCWGEMNHSSVLLQKAKCCRTEMCSANCPLATRPCKGRNNIQAATLTRTASSCPLPVSAYCKDFGTMKSLLSWGMSLPMVRTSNCQHPLANQSTSSAVLHCVGKQRCCSGTNFLTDFGVAFSFFSFFFSLGKRSPILGSNDLAHFGTKIFAVFDRALRSEVAQGRRCSCGKDTAQIRKDKEPPQPEPSANAFLQALTFL